MPIRIVSTCELKLKGGMAQQDALIEELCAAHGVNVAELCRQFNARTESHVGALFSVVVNVFQDGSFSLTLGSDAVSAGVTESVASSIAA